MSSTPGAGGGICLRLWAAGPGTLPGAGCYKFTALKPMPYQLDGEVRSVPTHATVRVESATSAPTVIG